MDEYPKCRPNMEHAKACGPTEWADTCACGCAADDTWCIAGLTGMDMLP